MEGAEIGAKSKRFFLKTVVLITFLCLAGVVVLSEVRPAYGQAELWSFATESAARHVLISDDGSKVVVGTDSGIVRGFTDGELSWSYNTDGYIRSMDMPDDGRYVAVASQNDNLYVLNGDDGEVTFVGNMGPVALDATPDGNYLAVLQHTLYSPFILLFSETGQIIRNLTMPLFNANAISISGDGSYVVVSGESQVHLVRMQDAAEWTRTAVDPDAQILSVQIAGSYVAYGTSGPDVEMRNIFGDLLWSTPTDNYVKPLEISADQQCIVACTGDYVANGSGYCSVYLIDRATGTPLWTYSVSDTFGLVYDAAISPDNSYVVAGSPTTLHFLDGRNGEVLHEYYLGNRVLSVSISSNGKYFLAGTDSGVMSFSTTVEEYALSIAVDGSGYTNPSAGVNMFEVGSEVSVIAYPDNGWSLNHWLLDGVNVGTGDPVDSQNMSYAVMMDSDHNLTAVFYPLSVCTLTIDVQGSGTTDPLPGIHVFEEGTTLVVEAFPEVYWNLSRWELDGVDIGDDVSQSIVMDSDHRLVAVFAYTSTQSPSVNVLDWSPKNPVENEEVKIQFSISGDANNLGAVTFWYRVSEGEWKEAALNFDGEIWTATIPGQRGGTTIDFYIECYDNLRRHAVSNSFSYNVKFPPTSLSLLLFATIGGTGVAATGIALYRVYWPGRIPSSRSLEKQLRKKNGKEKEREEREDEEETRRARKRGRPWLKLSIDFPRKVMKSSSSDIKVNLRNVGTASAKKIEIEVDSSGSLKLGKESDKIPELKPSKCSPTILFPFEGSEQFRRGECRLEFSYKSKQTRKRTSQRHLRAVKIGVISDADKPELSKMLESWLEKNGYSWDSLTSCDDLVRLLGYDLLLVAPEFECTNRGVDNLGRFVSRGQSVLFANKIISSENEEIARIMGYQQMQYRHFRSEESAMTISKNHFITEGFAEREKIFLGPCCGEFCTSELNTGEVLAFQTLSYKKDTPTIDVPAIIINNYDQGRTLHLNVLSKDFPFQLDSILKMAIDWLLFQD